MLICGGQSPRVGESFPLRWKIYSALQDPGSQLLPKWDYFESGQKHFFLSVPLHGGVLILVLSIFTKNVN